MDSKIRPIELSKIIVDPERFQTRVSLNEDRIGDYMQAIAAGDSFPAIEVAKYEGKHYLLSGFHRYEAYTRLGTIDTVQCHVVTGTYAELIAHSIASNAIHGVPMSQADRKRAANMLINARTDEGDPIGPQELSKLFHVGRATADRWLHPDRPLPPSAVVEPEQPAEDPPEIEPFHAEPEGVFEAKPPDLSSTPPEEKAERTVELVSQVSAAHMTYAKAHQTLGNIRDWVKKMSGTHPWGMKLNDRKARVMDALRETATAILDAAPDEVCPACNGTRCKECSQRGWMTVEEARVWHAERERKP